MSSRWTSAGSGLRPASSTSGRARTGRLAFRSWWRTFSRCPTIARSRRLDRLARAALPSASARPAERLACRFADEPLGDHRIPPDPVQLRVPAVRPDLAKADTVGDALVVVLGPGGPAVCRSAVDPGDSVGVARFGTSGADRDHSAGLAVAPVFAGPIQIVCTFVNSRMPKAESSRPYPDRFTPPNGRRGSDATMPLTNTLPDSIRRASRSASAMSRVQRLAPRP